MISIAKNDRPGRAEARRSRTSKILNPYRDNDDFRTILDLQRRETGAPRARRWMIFRDDIFRYAVYMEDCAKSAVHMPINLVNF